MSRGTKRGAFGAAAWVAPTRGYHIDRTAAASTGRACDGNPVETTGVFADLAKLRDALNNNDQAGITAAAQLLQQDEQNSTDARGQAGALTRLPSVTASVIARSTNVPPARVTSGEIAG